MPASCGKSEGAGAFLRPASQNTVVSTGNMVALTGPELPMQRRYLQHIDGLRAIAVLPVVLFHANVPGFSGGFVGVDIFFVISGFLITRILVRDLESGSFSLAAFYERRIRRIFPALFAVLAVDVSHRRHHHAADAASWLRRKPVRIQCLPRQLSFHAGRQLFCGAGRGAAAAASLVPGGRRAVLCRFSVAGLRTVPLVPQLQAGHPHVAPGHIAHIQRCARSSRA